MVTCQARTSWINSIFSMWCLHLDWPEIPARKQCCLKLQRRPQSNEQHKDRLMTRNFFFLLLQPLGCCYGKLLPMGCHHTQALTSLRCMICWKRAIGWSSQRGALPRCMNWWGHVSIFCQSWGQSLGGWEESVINSQSPAIPDPQNVKIRVGFSYETKNVGNDEGYYYFKNLKEADKSPKAGNSCDPNAK